MTYLTLLAALLLSGIAAYYSVIGLASIFVGAFWPVVFMGSSLEFAKVVTTSWLYRNWQKAPLLLKTYLTIAVVILMLITSMGIFGYLSKAHLEQSAEMAPLANKVGLYNEKIKVEKENIDANRKAIKQLDESVDQVMGRSTDEKGADKAVALRKTQQKERSRLLAETQESQRKVATLSDEVAPLSTELQKVESDFGPIKYVAELIYGSGERDLIDKAVRLVIMLIMLVFDPLAVLLLIAANMSMKETKEDLPTKEIDVIIKPSYEPDEEPITEQQVEQIKETVANKTTVDFEGVRIPGQDWIQTGPSFEVTTPTYPNISNEHEQVEIHHEPGVYEEHKVPVKKLEPKYDYDDPYAFREKENK
jgi:hypothetical protein